MQIGTVKQIWRYAVKTMGGEQLESCNVAPLGLRADRGWAIRDETTGEVTNGKYIPLLMQCESRYLESPSNGEISSHTSPIRKGRLEMREKYTYIGVYPQGNALSFN